MADAYWRYSDPRQPPPPQQATLPAQQQQSLPQSFTSLTGKRPRSDYDAASGHEVAGYYPHEDDRGALQGTRDSESIGASYDRYLRTAQMSSFGSGGQSARSLNGGVPSATIEDARLGMGLMDTLSAPKDRSLGFGSGRPEIPLPPDASSTLYVEGLPPDCTRREVSHIFRPFVGYKEARLVTKEPRHPGGAPLVLCFVDFYSPAHAATALDALQGYRFDEFDRDSVRLRLQFARNPGTRTGGGFRGKR